MKVPDLEVGKRLFVGKGNPSLCLGLGPTEIRGSSYIEGPAMIGLPFPNLQASLMVGPTVNTDIRIPPIVPGALCTGNNSPYTLAIRGPSAFIGVVDVARGVNVGTRVVAQGDVISQCGVHILRRKKNFDIPHPSKEGWRLTHACVEGPEAAVYVRGRVINQTEINLPEYWTNLVDYDTITVSLTPIGSHQDVIVKKIGDNKIYIQSKDETPIDCFYHIFGERIDTEKLIPEYEGTIEDYPGDNTQRSIAGYTYDTKE